MSLQALFKSNSEHLEIFSFRFLSGNRFQKMVLQVI